MNECGSNVCLFFVVQNKYREAYDKKVKGLPYAISSDTPELIRIKKAQEQLSEVLHGGSSHPHTAT